MAATQQSRMRTRTSQQMNDMSDLVIVTALMALFAMIIYCMEFCKIYYGYPIHYNESIFPSFLRVPIGCPAMGLSHLKRK